ncbi:MAG: alpha/beta hydrolase [Chloroflexi bacterium]|nr:alpha/beta hydrolase [Chloroflexota bacterium]
MARAQANGIEIEYESRGSGPSLVLINGYGSSHRSWRREFLAILARDLRITTFANRGTGGSSQPGEPWSLADFARDTVALIDALGLHTTHLLGLSMGGMIAQEVALQAPSRIERLILADTHCGPRTAAPSPPWVSEAFALDPQLTRREQAAKARPAVYSEGFLASSGDWLESEFERLEPFLAPPSILAWQLSAIREWDAFERLPKIRQRTLIIHGSEDLLVLPENGKVLAERIPNAVLELVEGSGHVPMSEQPEVTAGLVRDFLLSDDGHVA